MLDKLHVIIAVSYLAESIVMYQYYGLLLNCRLRLRLESVIIVFALFAPQIIKLYLFSSLPASTTFEIVKVIISFSIDLLLVILFYRGGFMKKLLAVAVLYGFMFVVCDSLPTLILMLIDNDALVPTENYTELEWYFVLLSRSFMPVLLIITNCLSKKKIIKAIGTQATAFAAVIVACVLVFSYYPLGNSENPYYSNPQIIYAFFVFLILLSGVLIIANILHRSVQRSLKDKLGAITKIQKITDINNEILAGKNKELEGQLHDIRLYRDYLAFLDLDIDGTFAKLGSSKRNKTGNRLVDNLLRYEEMKMEPFGIRMDVTGVLPEKIEWLAIEDMLTVIINSIDNAREALELLEKSVRKAEPIKVEFLYPPEGNQFTIIVENVFSRIPDVSTSSKPAKGHGLGIENIKTVAKMYDGEVTINVENGRFCMCIWLQRP